MFRIILAGGETYAATAEFFPIAVSAIGKATPWVIIKVSNGTVTEKQLNSVVTHSVNDEGEKHPVSPPVGDLMFDNFFLLSGVPEWGFHNRTVLVAKSLTDSNFEELVRTASEPPKKRRSEKEIAKAAARKSRALRRFVESAYPAEALFENFFDMMRAVGTFDKNDVWIRLYEPFDSISDLKDLDKVGRYYVLESPDFMPYEKLRTLMDSSPRGNRKTRPQDVVDLTHNQDARKGHVESYIVYHYLPKRSPEEIEAAYRAFGRLKKKLSSAKKVDKIDYELRWKTDKVLTNYCFNFAIYSPLQIVVENFVYGTSTYRETAMKVADYAEKVFPLFSWEKAFSEAVWANFTNFARRLERICFMLGHLHAKMGDGFDYRNGVADRDVLMRHFLVDFLIYRTDDRETNVKTIAALREADAFAKKNAALAELGVEPKLYDGGKLGVFAPGGALKEETDEPFDGDFSEAVSSSESIYGSRDESVAEAVPEAIAETDGKAA